ncbi:MAG: branched-chain amino acid ABC transporter permease [Gammaproteobacteria bacterium]|nr:branched-chain amino acid ABC transporter permease [Gammaproteobacteria bacterium]
MTLAGTLQSFSAFFARLEDKHPLLPWTVAFVGLLALPPILGALFNEYYIYLANKICIFILLSVGLNIVKGFYGQVTVGHVGLYAIGAVTSAILSINFGVPFWLILPTAVVVTGLAGVIVGVPSFRPEGAYLALATLELGESVRILISVTPYLGSSTGLGGIAPPVLFGFTFDSFARYFYLLMSMALLGIYLSFAILRSAMGRAFQAIREDTIAAAAAGINVRKYKFLAFVISALYAGAAGSMFAHMPPGYIHHNNFTIIEMVILLLMIVMGGIGHIWGDVVGAIVVTIIYDQTLAFYFYQPLLFGLAMVLLVVFMPNGIGGIIDRYLTTERFIKAREAARRGAT